MDYKKISLSAKDWIAAISIFLAADGILAFFYYRSLLVFLVLFLTFPFFFNLYKKNLIKKRNKQLIEEFSETLFSVSLNLKAGYSVENAFVEAYRDITLFYGKESIMAEEIVRIRKGLEINITLEELIEDLAVRSGEEDILLFSDVCKCAKRNGGNISEVLISTAEKIRDSICVSREIENYIQEKKLELRIMEVMPYFILLYLEITSSGYFNPLYEGIKGRIFMTTALILYISAVAIGEKIISIKA